MLGNPIVSILPLKVHIFYKLGIGFGQFQFYLELQKIDFFLDVMARKCLVHVGRVYPIVHRMRHHFLQSAVSTISKYGSNKCLVDGTKPLFLLKENSFAKLFGQFYGHQINNSARKIGTVVMHGLNVEHIRNRYSGGNG